MKGLYIGMGLLGALLPTVVFYVINLDRTIPGTFIDLGVVIYGAAVSSIFIPLGIVLGILTAGVIHLNWNMTMGWRRPSRPPL